MLMDNPKFQNMFDGYYYDYLIAKQQITQQDVGLGLKPAAREGSLDYFKADSCYKKNTSSKEIISEVKVKTTSKNDSKVQVAPL